uniref:ShKT domain-containing protein n=1 Tax=Panagrellus redivivus TaxID=6233 RepID=A0A7E4VJI6_PANRE
MKLFGCLWLLLIAISIVVGQPHLSDISSLSHNLKNYNVVPIDMWDQSHPADINGHRYLSTTVPLIAPTVTMTTLAPPTTTTVTTTTTTTEIPTVLIDTETNNVHLVDGESNQIIQAAVGWEAEEAAVEAAEVVEMFDGIPCLGPVPKVTTTLPPCALLALKAMEKTSTTVKTEVPTSTTTVTSTTTPAPSPVVIVTVRQEVDSVDQGVDSFEESAEEVPETPTTVKPKKSRKSKKHRKITTTTTTEAPEDSESDESVEEISATTTTATSKPKKAKVAKMQRKTTTTTTETPEEPEIDEEYAEEVVITTTIQPKPGRKKPIVTTTESTTSEYDDVAELEQIIEAAHAFLLRLNTKTTTDEPTQSQTIWQDSDAKIPSSTEPPLDEGERPQTLSEVESDPSEVTTMPLNADTSDAIELEKNDEETLNARDDVLITLLQPGKITIRNPSSIPKAPLSRPTLTSQSLPRWNPTPGQCPNEKDRLDTTFCTELANQGRCSTNRVTRFFFCRQTCLCAPNMGKLSIFNRGSSASTSSTDK